MSGTIVADVTDRPAGRSAAEFAGALGARLDLRLKGDAIQPLG